jgi:hypothetical protein
MMRMNRRVASEISLMDAKGVATHVALGGLAKPFGMLHEVFRWV